MTRLFRLRQLRITLIVFVLCRIYGKQSVPVDKIDTGLHSLFRIVPIKQNYMFEDIRVTSFRIINFGIPFPLVGNGFNEKYRCLFLKYFFFLKNVFPQSFWFYKPSLCLYTRVVKDFSVLSNVYACSHAKLISYNSISPFRKILHALFTVLNKLGPWKQNNLRVQMA